MYTSADAQVRVSISANIGRQPMWGPAGYNYAQFYYLPDINMYYDVQARQFVYCDRGRWIYTSTLPTGYRNYDLYRGYKVVVNEPMPYLHNNAHRHDYRKFKNYHQHQVIIYDSYDHRYDRDDRRYDGYNKKYNDDDGHRFDDAKRDRDNDRDGRW